MDIVQIIYPDGPIAFIVTLQRGSDIFRSFVR